MKAVALPSGSTRLSLFRSSNRDALLVVLAVAQGVLVWWAPLAPLIAIGLWWNSQTVSHYFLHKPFFRSRALNGAFSFYLSVLLGVPQSLWRSRHLAHHAGGRAKLSWTPTLAVEVVAIVTLWVALLAVEPFLFLLSYLPGYVGGLILCQIHGHYEHPRGVESTVSHRGSVYNWIFFNDGYHAEHHAAPGAHWSELPRRAVDGAPTSRWPAVLRWLDGSVLEGLEALVLRSKILQAMVLSMHERAFRALVAEVDDLVRGSGVGLRVGIVGGGLFPRTALILRRLLPGARLTVIDANREHLDMARRRLEDEAEFLCGMYDPDEPSIGGALGIEARFDLLVIPLSYRGDLARIYEQPPAPIVIVHDWIWRRRGRGRTRGRIRSRIVSWLLLKRVTLVEADR